MIIDVILFPLYTLFIAFVGLGFLTIFESAISVKRDQYDIFIYPLVGLFAIGMISILINFFSGVAISLTYALISAFLLVGIYNLKVLQLKSILWILAFSILLTPLAAFMRAGGDAGLYHLPHQLWLRTEEIVFGLANFHARFGFSSILEYIHAPMWIHENFKLLSYNVAIFGIAFFLFLKKLLDDSKFHDWLIGKAFVLFILVNLLVYDDYFNWWYGYTDVPAGLLYVMSFLLGWQIFTENQEKTTSRVNIFTFVFLSLYAFMMKLSAAILFLWLLGVVLYLFYKKKTSILTFLRVNAFNIFLFFVFIVKNVITSGCLLFPLSSSCVSVSWNAYSNAAIYSDVITAWARHPRTGRSSLENWNWLQDWWINAHYDFLMWIMVTIILISTLALFLVFFSKKNNFDAKLFSSLASIAFILISLSFWFIKAPTPRFGIGIFILLGPIVGFFIVRARFAIISVLPNIVLKILLIVLAFKIGNTELFFTKIAPENFAVLQVRQIKTVPDKNYGVRPQKGDECWTAPKCCPYNRPEPRVKGGYMFFINSELKK